MVGNEESDNKINNEKQKQDKSTQKPSGNRLVALCGVFTALAMILSYLESLVPVSVAVPGIKLGLANLITIISLKKLGLKPTIVISVSRIVLSGILFSNVAVIGYSLAGAALSILVMLITSKIKIFSITGISICGAIAHNFGQLIVAAIFLENARIFYYMSVLSIAGAVFGCIIGLVAGSIMKNINL